MTALVPDPLADLIRTFVKNSPREIEWPLFSALVAIYAWVIVGVVSRLWCWLDYQLATALRRAGSTPLSLQYALGEVVKGAPRWTTRAGLAFFLITVAWAIVAFSIVPPPNTPLHWFQVTWRRFLLAIWS